MGEPMTGRIRQRLQFELERLVVRGPHYRLLFVAALIGLVSLSAGTMAYAVGSFAGLEDAIWWAFLRLTDPGYLGDDEGALLRTVSTVVTVLGYVLFMGALIAIMTQWFVGRMRALEQGLTPIAQNNHLLVLGWTNRTPGIVLELMRSEEKVRRFLKRRGARRVQVVVLAEDVSAERVQDLREKLGPHWDSRRITMRSGTPLRIEHLRRVDYANAAAILVPAADFGEAGAEAADTHTIKTVLSIGAFAPEDLQTRSPLVVAEVFDPRKTSLAQGAYEGPMEVVAGDRVVARLMAQNMRQPGLSAVYTEILAHGEGCELYVRDGSELAGHRVRTLHRVFPSAVVLGLVRPAGGDYEPLLSPEGHHVVEAGDRIVLLAGEYEDIEPRLDVDTEAADEPPARMASHQARDERRVLVLGWSHRVPALLQELQAYTRERFRICLASSVAVAEREAELEHYGLTEPQLEITHARIDYTVPNELARMEPSRYDNVVLVASDWLRSGEQADARTVLGELLVRQMTKTTEARPHLLAELSDEANESLLERHGTEVLTSPVILSHMLAQVALRRELQVVFDELFGPGGPEIVFRDCRHFEIQGETLTFGDLQDRIAAWGQVVLGIRRGDGEVLLNPSRQHHWHLGAGDQAVVLTSG
jgi:hypothetical protein